ncbi:multidrug resistance efflux transporter family protein [Brevibacillus centrosporus]|uniref:DMT family transporter n=1 Tax=Brevibacillus centrosporus TaxID=54910 RepID=UPI000F0A2141|nr:multidrug resistance efflux transporter family protein [Brevibacillus centrosporus]MEC2128037.1 multidrug resistance efflux transporter family protein [Brevibacillus centrosporus]RNB67663.1 multidrug resistance efflux transporter family protein [Brevibacillus centrosporus]GED30999.1 membrane protein [Brevibacillus centrosporus]
MRAILLGVVASLFFATTFVLNRAMELSGGSWLYSASLRYLFMVPFLLVIVGMRRGLQPLWEEMKATPWQWGVWSFVGFGLFYAPLCFAAIYSPGWLIAGTWQVTIIAGSLLVPLFGQKIPYKGLLMSMLILAGVGLMQLHEAASVGMKEVLLGIGPIVVAAFAYPLGNRKMMAMTKGRIDAYQRVLGMTLASLPFWVLLAIIGFVTEGAPSSGQTLQSLLVALSSGIVATVLFFQATDLAKGNAQQLAVVEATQAGEVVFAVMLEMMLLSAPLPGLWSNVGMLLVIFGMVLHSYVSSLPQPKKTSLF